MKILHFSDIHTGAFSSNLSALLDKRLIGGLNYTFRRKKHIHWEFFERFLEIIKEEQPDVVISTGDFTSTSAAKEFAEVRERMSTIVSNTNFRFFCVPGNHDYYTNDKKSLQIRKETFDYLNRKQFSLDQLPLRLEIDGVHFILIDQSKPNTLSQSSGILRDQDFEKIESWISEKKESPAIIVGHYPMRDAKGIKLEERRALENGDKLYTLLQSGQVDLALCGHIHHPFARWEDSGSAELCAGSLTIGGKVNKII